MFFDPLYFLFLAPGILLSLWAQWRVKSAYWEASRYVPRSGYTGADAAEAVMHAGGVVGVGVEPIAGELTDHYDPSTKVLRLSTDVYRGRTLAALGIAAHEAGHAIQDARHYPLLVARSFLVPMASFGGNISWLLIMLGFLLASFNLIMAGIIAFSATVVFQLVNLPVEFDASRRARLALVEGGLVTADEDVVVRKVLSAAALTYVAATLTSLLTLLYFLYRAGVLGGGRRD